jgi:Methyltransferase domain
VYDSRDTIDIGSVVTDEAVLDFMILYESLVESWTTFPFVLHAFAVDDGVAARLEEAEVERLEIHRVSADAGALGLVEHSGLERCIVSAPENVFLAETPELWFLLDSHDLVFAGAPAECVWAFRRTDRRLTGFNLVGPSAEDHNPYRVEADRLRGPVVRDWLGFVDERGGRIKVLSLPGLGRKSEGSLGDRIDAAIARFPRIAPLLPFYASLANRAALRLGIEGVPNVRAFTRDRLLHAAILATRNELPELLNRRGLCGVGAEIGVKRGRFSETILHRWRGRKLISVDPWAEAPDGEYADVANVEQAEHERFYEDTVDRLARFGERSSIWRMTAIEAAQRIDPGSLDFVYLDARHDYGSVMEDLEHWFDKIRPGGIIAGHDYVDGTLPAGDFGVKSAVDEFFATRGLTVRQTYVEGGSGALLPSWLVELPESPLGPLVS